MENMGRVEGGTLQKSAMTLSTCYFEDAISTLCLPSAVHSGKTGILPVP